MIMTSARSLLVTGDVQIDHCIYEGDRAQSYTRASRGTQSFAERGGAYVIYQILTGLNETIRRENQGNLKIDAVDFGLSPSIFARLNKNMHRWGIWRSFNKWPGNSPPAGTQTRVWRLDETLGYGQDSRHAFSYTKYRSEQLNLPSRILVINDNGLGYRRRIAEASWPPVLREPRTDGPQWIFLKMSKPLAQGDLWDCLISTHAEKLITLVSIQDLRRESVHISKGISWEQTILDLVNELCFNVALERLMKSRLLVISIGSAGALVVENLPARQMTLFYDPAMMEGEFENQVPGRGLGYMSCIASGLASGLMRFEDRNAVLNGIQAGLSASRTVHIEGHGEITRQNNKPGFPYQAVISDILTPRFRYSQINMPIPSIPEEYSRQKNWTILGETLKAQQRSMKPLYGLGIRVALTGENALQHIPFERFGALFTVDRDEIEALRGIRRLVTDYEEKKIAGKPLSIAVFGPPGAGKSFGVKQIAIGVLGNDVPFLEFNLSQFPEDPLSLIGALHQVRDKVLEGKTPVVFWDEFDSKEYFWLQYLLAPMQDGKFQEGQITHPIGKCIFVFAGGTSYDAEHFGPPDPSKETDGNDKLTESQKADRIRAYHEFKLRKGPDFISRLNGTLNVLGPNPRPVYNRMTGTWEPSSQDVCFPLRRAMMLRSRSMFNCGKNKRLQIDPSVLSAFIEIDAYIHGSRSLQKIVDQMKHPKQDMIYKSDFPPAQLISTHVDTVRFMKIMNRELPFRLKSSDLAPTVHSHYRQLGREQGWLKQELDKNFEDLAESYKEDNRAAARRIPEILALIGLYVVPQDFNEPGYSDEPHVQEIIENCLELLAEEEHNGWMKQKLINGWTFGKRDESKKQHDCLTAYDALNEAEKQKDRDSVKHFTKIIQEAGFKVVSYS
jgi:hypothetical protein